MNEKSETAAVVSSVNFTYPEILLMKSSMNNKAESDSKLLVINF